MSSSIFIKRDSAALFESLIKIVVFSHSQNSVVRNLPKTKEVIARYLYLNLQNHRTGRSKLCYKVVQELIKQWRDVFNLPVRTLGRVYSKVIKNIFNIFKFI